MYRMEIASDLWTDVDIIPGPTFSAPSSLECFVQSALQEALRANVALEDINRTALVRLKQVSINVFGHRMKNKYHACNSSTNFAFRDLRSLVSGSPTRFHPRMPRKTLRTAVSVLLTGLRCEHQ